MSKKNAIFKRGIYILLSLTLAMGIIVPSNIQAQAALDMVNDLPFETILMTDADLDFDDVAFDAKSSNLPKMDSALAQLVEAYEDSKSSASEAANALSLNLNGELLQVQVSSTAQLLHSAVELIHKAGGQVSSISGIKNSLQAWVPISSLQQLVAAEAINYIQRPTQLVLFEDVKVGASTTDAVNIVNASAWHSNNYKGQGVKVAIIDGGFTGYTSLLGSDLPASVVAMNFVDFESQSQVDGSSAHGTACAEIVHDMAPEASLYLVKIATDLDLEEAVNWLITQQVDVISTSLGWYNISPGDGTGYFSDLVQLANNAGIFWTTAASNDREAHWGGLFSDSDDDGYHQFNGVQEVNFFGPGGDSAYYIPAGYLVSVFLRWDDWTNVDQDYDLYIVRNEGSGWEIFAAGNNIQDGSAGQTPTEFASFYTAGSDAFYGIIIENYDATRAVNFELFVPKFYEMDELVYERSISNLADAPQAVTVAALDATSPYPQEEYSSQGPTNGLGGALTGGAIKPDIAAFANVATQSYGGTTFNGTSAATPHVAGAAALVLGANPSYSHMDIRSFLEGQAIDMGSPGKDNLFGYGRLALGDAPVSKLPISLNAVTPNNGDNFGAALITISGENFTSDIEVKLTQTGMDDINATNVQLVNATTATCVLNLSFVPVGLRDVVVSSPGADPGLLEDAFTVTAFTGTIYTVNLPIIVR